MLDLVFVCMTVTFFAISLGYGPVATDSGEANCGVRRRCRPRIEVLTLNGFRFSRPPGPTDLQSNTHVFQLTHFPDGVESTVTAMIDPQAIGRVTRLTRRELRPGGAFWRDQAQRLLSAHLWSQGKPPVDGRLTVRDVSREDLDVAEAWDSD